MLVIKSDIITLIGGVSIVTFVTNVRIFYNFNLDTFKYSEFSGMGRNYCFDCTLCQKEIGVYI